MAIYIKELRKKKGISQSELAESLGIQPNYMEKLESGYRALTNDWVAKLTKALNCEPWELCDDSDFFFSRENLHKLFKNSINLTGGNYGHQNIAVDHSNIAPLPETNQYEKELVDVFKQLTIRKQNNLLSYAYGLLEEKD